MYNNLHNKDLDTIIYLTSEKQIWDILLLVHGESSSKSVEKGKRKRKEKKPYQKESVQLNETYACGNVAEFHEEMTYEHQVKLDLSLSSIEKLKNENKDLKKLVQIRDEREHEYKEEIVSLKTQLEEARRIEEAMSIKFKERDLQCERLKDEIGSTISKLEEKNSWYK